MNKKKTLALVASLSVGALSLGFLFNQSYQSVQADDTNYKLTINSPLDIENGFARVTTTNGNSLTLETNGTKSNGIVNLSSTQYLQNYSKITSMESIKVNYDSDKDGILKIAFAHDYDGLSSAELETININQSFKLFNYNYFKLVTTQPITLSNLEIVYNCDVAPSTIYYDVVFDAKGGTPAPKKQIVEASTKAVEPAEPSKDYYDFDGWYIPGEETKFNFNTAITKDITLEARYKEKVVKSLTLTPSKTKFTVGDAFSSDGLVVVANYVGGQSRTLSSLEYSLDSSAFNNTKAGTYNIKVTYKTTNATYQVEVASKKRLSVLMVGNSFAVDTINYLGALANDAGFDANDLDVAVLYHPACTIDMHYQNALSNKKDYQLFYFHHSFSMMTSADDEYSIKDGLEFSNWDYISFQQGSDYTGISDSYGNLGNLIKYCRDNSQNKDVKIIFNETWALADYYLKTNMPQYGGSQINMYNMIRSVMESDVIKSHNFDMIVPINTALQIARGSIWGDAFNRDGRHLTPAGMYLASMTFFCKITGQTPDLVKFVEPNLVGDSEPNANNLMRWTICNAVNLAIANPNVLAESAFSIKGLTSTTSYAGHTFDRADLGYINGSYYNSVSGVDLIVPEGGDNRYLATKKFTKETLPTGSLVIQKSCISNVVDPSTNPFLDNFYGYRPEAWLSEAPQSTRPDYYYLPVLYVTDAWWGSYTKRAFNISLGRPQEAHGSGLKALGDYSAAREQFVILIPHSN